MKIIYIIIAMEKSLYTNNDIINLLKEYHDNNKSHDIINHNFNIKMPLLTEMLLEKAFFLNLENKNIINKSNYKSTPLINTQLSTTIEGPMIDLIIYWLVVFRLFAHEFNILVPAFKYCLYKNNNNKYDKHAYNLWQIRQMSTYFKDILPYLDVKAEIFVRDLLSF